MLLLLYFLLKCYDTIDMLQKIEKNFQKYVMMLITTKTHNERVKVFLHEQYSTRSTVSSTGSEIFIQTWRNRSKYPIQS